MNKRNKRFFLPDIYTKADIIGLNISPNIPRGNMDIEYVNPDMLWHNNNEEPEHSLYFLFVDDEGDYNISSHKLADDSPFQNTGIHYEGWSGFCKRVGLKHWAYIRDLLPLKIVEDEGDILR